MESQEKQILRYLQSGLSLTAYQALIKFDCFRLASRVNRLRNRGHDIKTKMKEIRTGKKIAQYYIEL